MNKQIITFDANEQSLIKTGGVDKYSSNKVSYIEAHFNLGENWSGYDSIRAVWFTWYECISTVLDSDGVCIVPHEVLTRTDKVMVNLVGSISEDDVLTDRMTTYPVLALTVDANAKVCGSNTQPITPSEFEQYVAIVRSLVETVKDIDHISLNSDYTLTIYYSDGTSDTTGSVRGADGNGIESVTKTGTSGLVDTYTITFTDGQTTTFTVTNGARGDTGNGIASIEKTSTVGLVDTYTITFTDGNTTTFTVTNGEKGDKGDTGEVSQAEFDEAIGDLKSAFTYLEDEDAFTTYLRTLFSLSIWYLGEFRVNSIRLSTTVPMSFPYDITVNNPFGNACTVLEWSSATPSDASLIRSTGYSASEYPEVTIPAGTLFTLTYSKTGNQDFALSDVGAVYVKSSYTKGLEAVYANIDDVKGDTLYFEETGRERIDLIWTAGAYNASGTWADAGSYRTQLLHLPAGQYHIYSETATYAFCYEDESYTGGRGATFPWGGTGDNILTVDSTRGYIGIYSVKLNGGLPPTVLSCETGLLKKINGKIDKASTTDLMGNVLTVDYTGEISPSDALFSGEIQRKYVWESGGINASGKYNSNDNKRTKDLIYLADGDYLINPNGAGKYYIIAFSDDEYSSGRATLWGVTGTRHFSVGGGRNYIGIMCEAATPLDDLSIPLVTLSKTNSESITEVLPPVPWYYTEDAYMSSKLASLQAELEAVSNGDAFVFFTDLHIADNACSSFPIIRDVLRETPIDKVICGGDIPTAYNEGTTFISPMDDAEDSLKLQARKYGRLVNSYIKPYASYFGVRGNHDFHIQQNASSEMITEPYSWTYNYLIRNAEKDAVLESDNAYYYFDNKSQKIRYIFLNEYDSPDDSCKVSQAQYDWLIETLNVSADWEIVVIGHTPIYSEMTSYESVLAPVWGILTAYQNRRTYSYSGDVSINANFSSANGIIVGYFCGHNHRSEDFFVDNVLTMSFICDARYTTSQITRQYKTTSEASVAVLVIDKDNGTVKEINCGAGFDRSKTYK